MSPAPISVTVVGKDRPGIVSAVSEALFELGCNLEDATSTILRGHFSMMLVVRPPEGTSAEAVNERLERVGTALGLVVAAQPMEDSDTDPPIPSHMVSVYGGDRPGIVFRVADVLVKTGANITDLTSRLIGTDEAPVYAVMMEAALVDPGATEASLERLREELGLDVSVHPLEADVL
jgi:glycine cleavage system transcriptional repressor